MKGLKNLIALAVTAAMTTGFTASASAQEYPEKPVKVVVPSSAGGASDVVARMIQKAVEDELPQPMVIVNMPGAGTALGSREVASSPADGYTMLMMHEAMLAASAQGIFETGRTSLTPVAQTGRDVYTIVVNASSPYKTLDELYEAAREGRVTTGVNIGGLNHFTSLIAAKAANVEFQPVQYAGGAESLKALLGEHVDVIFAVPSDVIAYQESGDLRILAAMAEERISALPDVPTTKELGYEAYSELNHMWWVPADTPADRINVLAGALEAGMEDEEVKEQFSKRFIEPVFLSGDDIKQRVETAASTIEGLVEEFDLRSN